MKQLTALQKLYCSTTSELSSATDRKSVALLLSNLIYLQIGKIEVIYVILQIPEYSLTIHEGDTIQIGKFDHMKWVANFGWYSVNGNKPICGWYLRDAITQEVRSLQYTDLPDIYLVG